MARFEVPVHADRPRQHHVPAHDGRAGRTARAASSVIRLPSSEPVCRSFRCPPCSSRAGRDGRARTVPSLLLSLSCCEKECRQRRRISRLGSDRSDRLRSDGSDGRGCVVIRLRSRWRGAQMMLAFATSGKERAPASDSFYLAVWPRPDVTPLSALLEIMCPMPGKEQVAAGSMPLCPYRASATTLRTLPVPVRQAGQIFADRRAQQPRRPALVDLARRLGNSSPRITVSPEAMF